MTFDFGWRGLPVLESTPQNLPFSEQAAQDNGIRSVALPAIEGAGQNLHLRLDLNFRFSSSGADSPRMVREEGKEPRSARARREVVTSLRTDSSTEELTPAYATTLIKNYAQDNQIGKALDVMEAIRKQGGLNNIHMNCFLGRYDIKGLSRENCERLNRLIDETGLLIFGHLFRWMAVNLELGVYFLDTFSAVLEKMPIQTIDIPRVFYFLLDRYTQCLKIGKYERKNKSQLKNIHDLADRLFGAVLLKANEQQITNPVVFDLFYTLKGARYAYVAQGIFNDVYNLIYSKNPERARWIVRAISQTDTHPTMQGRFDRGFIEQMKVLLDPSAELREIQGPYRADPQLLQFLRSLQ